MSFWDCIQRAVDANEAESSRAQATQEAWRRQADEYARFHDRRTAEEMAYEDVKEAFKRATGIKKHQRLRDLEIMRRNVAELRAADSLYRAVRSPLERNETDRYQPDNVWFMSRALEQQFQGMMRQFFKDVNRNIVGNIKNKTTLKNVLRELHGESAGDQVAADMASAVRKTFERMRHLFNDAGGHISSLDDFGVPHSHDRRLIEKAGEEAWIEKVTDRINWERMEDFATGRPMSESSDQVRRQFLSEVYKNIVTQNRSKMEPRYGPTQGTGRMGDRYAGERILHFKSADDWMAYNDEFGTTDSFGAITKHMHRMARDIALMRTFGTNPKMGLEHRIQVARKMAADVGDTKAMADLDESEWRTRAMMNHITGETSAPVNEWWANFLSGTRMFLTSSYLGGAILASGGDLAAMRMAAKSIGMRPNNVLSRHTKLMASSMTRETAAQLGYIADTLTDAGNTLARFLGDVPSNEILERLTSFTMRAQGLSYWTDMGRTAFRMEMAGFFAENAGRPLSEVTPALRVVLEKRGVTADDWAKFSDPENLFVADNGAKFLSPMVWLERTNLDRQEAERLALKFGSIIEEQTEFAIPTMTLEGRSMVEGSTRPGTILGEVARSGLMFKSFALSVWMNQYRRILSRPTPLSKAQYAAEMLAAFTAMGALSLQIKEMAKGNDPRPMDSTKFWGAALLQGGGVGIVGDLLAAGDTRMGGGLAEYIAGPVIGFAGDVQRTTVGNVLEFARGEDTNIGRDVSKLVTRNTPVLSSLWYTRTAVDRLLFDELQMLLDPEATASMRASAQRRQREYGTTSFWRDAEPVPYRAPNLLNALGQ